MLIALWTTLDHVSLLVTAIATLLLVGGLIVAAWQLNATRKATQLAAAIDLLREYRSPKMRRARLQIHELPDFDKRTLRPSRGLGLDQLGKRDREAVEMVGHYLDNLGLLIEQGLLERAPAEAFLGLSAQGMWDKLGPYIRDERSTKPSRATYQCNFEKFVTPHPRRRWWRRG